jgi:hypothetical protein
MHHGAEGNWHEGVAPRIAPAISIFSSDPKNKKLRHPHRPVLDEFRQFNPYQVDKRRGVVTTGLLLTDARSEESQGPAYESREPRRKRGLRPRAVARREGAVEEVHVAGG